MARPRALTTTSFAILGQLASRPWSAYELSRQMKRNFRFFWPRAESLLYAEMKELARAGLAKTSRHMVGRRATTTYAITKVGRTALEEWLARPATPPLLECETLLRVFMSPRGTVANVEGALDGMRDWLDEAYEVAQTVGGEYVAGTSEFQDDVHVRALVFDFLVSYFMMLDDWRARSTAEIATWRDMRGTPAARSRAKKKIAQLLEAEVGPRREAASVRRRSATRDATDVRSP